MKWSHASRLSRSQVRILVVDDHPIVRAGLSNYLAGHKRFVVVGEAKDGQEALTRVRELLPDLVVMDIEMPSLNGLLAAETLHREYAEIKVVLLSDNGAQKYALEILKCGAHGALSKRDSLEQLVEGIETIAFGGTFFHHDAVASALEQSTGRDGDRRGYGQISRREREVLLAITDGLSNKEIASRLGMAVRTVETHRERIMNKLNLHSVARLTRFAIAQGLISLPEAAAE